jgi:2-oxoglutarate/2-oxoacid ferredoxin oxidoreductase subunit beta
MTEQTPPTPARTRQEYLSDIEPKWCMGCGCFAMLKNLTNLFAELNIPREKIVLVSGIGCSSRTPYYMNTYGFHTIHGRAPAVALGLKLTRPELSVWIMTGDGDGLAIGGNHFLHLMRRNPDIKMLLFNNQIYGLTKGQPSPTTRPGTHAKGVPDGSYEPPVRPAALAIAAGASFVARIPDIDAPLTNEVLRAAAAHRGTAFIEVLINCVTFNDGTYTALTSREQRSNTTLRLTPNAPLVFGAKSERGIALRGLTPTVVEFEPGKPPADLLVHNPAHRDSSLAYALASIDAPVLLGIIRQVEAPVYEETLPAPAPTDTLAAVLQGENSWRV